MFTDYKSRLGKQIQPVSGGSIKNYTGTQFDYACTESTNVPVERKKILFPERYVKSLVQLFEQSIDPNTFEHMVAAGNDVGLGLFSFADFNKNPKLGLYLTYRESAQMFVGFTPEFYLGAYENPCDYDKVFQEGVENAIWVAGEGFKSAKSSGNVVNDIILANTIETLEKEAKKIADDCGGKIKCLK